MENIAQSCWNKHDFIDMLKHAAFFPQKFSGHEILSACKDEVEVSQYLKKLVGLSISFLANVAQICRKE